MQVRIERLIERPIDDGHPAATEVRDSNRPFQSDHATSERFVPGWIGTDDRYRVSPSFDSNDQFDDGVITQGRQQEKL